MTALHAVHRTIRLQTSLEAVVSLGEGYLLAGAGWEWRARDLLERLRHEHPALLTLPVALVLPGATSEGAILDVDSEGEVITNRPLYRIEQRLPLVSLR